MKYQVKRVKGAQADMARSLGLVKIAKSSAKDLFELGVPLVLVGNKVNGHHFFGGWHLAMDVDSQRYLREGESFDALVNNWSHYNENNETGKAAFFVDKKHIGGKGGVGGGKKRHVKGRGPQGPKIPRSWPVQPLRPGQVARDAFTCGTCGLSWDDAKVTSMTPTPSGRCPFEGFHHYDGGKRRHAKQWKLVTARGGDVLGKERAPSARLALSKHRAKGHGTTGVAAVRAGGKRRHASKQPSVGKLARELDSMLKG